VQGLFVDLLDDEMFCVASEGKVLFGVWTVESWSLKRLFLLIIFGFDFEDKGVQIVMM
jgi:hypothetical protein